MIGQDFARIIKPTDANPIRAVRLGQGTLLADETEQGEREAFERGRAAGLEQAKAETTDLLARQGRLLDTLVQELRATRELLLKDAEEPIAALALEIAGKVLRERHDAVRESVVAQVREAVARVKDGGPLKVLVHPADAPLLEQARDLVSASMEEGAILSIEPDPRISPGGCMVETPEKLVDARIETQLVRIGEALKRGVTRGK